MASNVTGENCDKLETTYVHTTIFAGENFEWWHFDITKTHQIHRNFFSSKLHRMAYNKHGILMTCISIAQLNNAYHINGLLTQ